MRHHDDGAPLGELAHHLGDGGLVLPVQGRGDLVEQQDGGVLDEGPGDGDTLTLPTGQAQPAGTDLRVPPVRQRLDDAVQAGAPGGLGQLGVGGLGPGDAQVLPDGGVEQVDVLEDHGGHAHDRRGAHGADRCTTDGDGPVVDVPEPGGQAQDRGLARP